MCVPSLPLEVKIGHGLSRQGKNQRVRDQDNDPIIPSQKAKRRDVGRPPHKNMQHGQEDMGADGLSPNCRKYVPCHGI